MLRLVQEIELMVQKKEHLKYAALSIPLEVVNEEHDKKNALSCVSLNPDFVEEKTGNGEGRAFLEKPSEFGVELANCKGLIDKL